MKFLHLVGMKNILMPPSKQKLTLVFHLGSVIKYGHWTTYSSNHSIINIKIVVGTLTWSMCQVIIFHLWLHDVMREDSNWQWHFSFMVSQVVYVILNGKSIKILYNNIGSNHEEFLCRHIFSGSLVTEHLRKLSNIKMSYAFSFIEYEFQICSLSCNV